MQILTAGKLNRTWIISGFSLVELIVVMFILSVLTAFTLPMFKVPGMGQNGKAAAPRDLARFIGAVRLKAVKDNQEYHLHLDLVSGRTWADISNEGDTSGKPGTNENKGQESGPSGLLVSRVDFVDQRAFEQEDIVIRISRTGITDMALIHMETDDGDITLKLHPFINEVEIIQENQSFNDCL